MPWWQTRNPWSKSRMAMYIHWELTPCITFVFPHLIWWNSWQCYLKVNFIHVSYKTFHSSFATNVYTWYVLPAMHLWYTCIDNQMEHYLNFIYIIGTFIAVHLILETMNSLKYFFPTWKVYTCRETKLILK